MSKSEVARLEFSVDLLSARANNLEKQLAAAQERVKVLEAALTQIASYGEGVEVTGKFDEPHAARVARAALTGVEPAKG